jgi:hypothetical protein
MAPYSLQMKPTDGSSRPGPTLRGRLLWFVGLYVVSVAVVMAVAYVLRRILIG